MTLLPPRADGNPVPARARSASQNYRPRIILASPDPVDLGGWDVLVSPDREVPTLGVAVAEFNPARFAAGLDSEGRLQERKAGRVARIVRELQEMGFAAILAPIPEPVQVRL